MCSDELLPRVYNQMGKDDDNLGRWTWARIQGRHGTFLRIISAYRPVINTSDVGSTYQQHLQYFRSKGIQECPRKLFDKHLKHLLEEWVTMGDHIILDIDANEDV